MQQSAKVPPNPIHVVEKYLTILTAYFHLMKNMKEKIIFLQKSTSTHPKEFDLKFLKIYLKRRETCSV